MSDAENDQSPRKRGRPAGKRGTFSFRVTADLRARLEAEAAATGRPVSEEIEKRLEQSFDVPQIIEAAWSHFSVVTGGRDMLHAGIMLGRLFERANTIADHQLGDDRRWYDDEAKRKAVTELFIAGLPRVMNGLAKDAQSGFPEVSGPGSLRYPHPSKPAEE